MARLMQFLQDYPGYHDKAGQPTYFIEKIYLALDELYGEDFKWKQTLPLEFLNRLVVPEYKISPKWNTIREGKRWRVGEIFKPVTWEQTGGRMTKGNIAFDVAPNIEIKKIWNIRVDNYQVYVNNKIHYIGNGLSVNTGFENPFDFIGWFMGTEKYRHTHFFEGQIISWSDKIEY